MKSKSIRKLYVQDVRLLEEIMGYNPGSLRRYAGRYVEIRVRSPKKITGPSGMVYLNG